LHINLLKLSNLHRHLQLTTYVLLISLELFLYKLFVVNICVHSLLSVAATKGDTEPERNETRNKVDEDRKHEYPFIISINVTIMCVRYIYIIYVFTILGT